MSENATEISEFQHPKRGIYLLGAEDHGLPPKAIEACHYVVNLKGNHSLNVAVAGSIVAYDRITKMKTELPTVK
jgi:tRNA G18 (ribose-2'-O)-methylase SpoU